MTVGSLRAWGLKGQGWSYTGERNAEERQFCVGQNNEAAFGCAGGQGELGLFALDSTRGRRGLVKVYSTAHVSVECPVWLRGQASLHEHAHATRVECKENAEPVLPET